MPAIASIHVGSRLALLPGLMNHLRRSDLSRLEVINVSHDAIEAKTDSGSTISIARRHGPHGQAWYLEQFEPIT